MHPQWEEMSWDVMLCQNVRECCEELRAEPGPWRVLDMVASVWTWSKREPSRGGPRLGWVLQWALRTAVRPPSVQGENYRCPPGGWEAPGLRGEEASGRSHGHVLQASKPWLRGVQSAEGPRLAKMPVQSHADCQVRAGHEAESTFRQPHWSRWAPPMKTSRG